MKIFRIAIISMFMVCCCICSVYYVNSHILRDVTIPEIKFNDKEIVVPIDATDEDLIKGMTAVDGKDGDITSKIVVESVSTFIEPGKSIVTYAVCDSDKHVSHAKRTVIYDGYTHPKFYLNRSLIFSVDEVISLTNAFSARDVIDGDISSNIIITVPDYTPGDVGTFTVHTMVSNSKGDTINADYPLIVEELPADAPEIELTNYLIYVNGGKKIDPKKYISMAYDASGNDLTDKVVYKSKKAITAEGLYKVDYYVTAPNGSRGHAALLIVPEN